jgi:hypothetical protein
MLLAHRFVNTKVSVAAEAIMTSQRGALRKRSTALSARRIKKP